MNIRILPLFCIIACVSYAVPEPPDQNPETNSISPVDIASAERLAGLAFNDAKRELMVENLTETRKKYEQLRSVDLNNSDPPAIVFNPILPGMTLHIRQGAFRVTTCTNTVNPVTEEECAYYTIGQLAELIRTRKITVESLTKLYLKRLKKYGPGLECVITILEDRAMQQARQADLEIANGKYRGLLHGIPYGVKDLLALKGTVTTWGSAAHTNQIIDETATVITRLDKAGAILTAKLTLGSLAMGDIWYGGMTRCPWNRKEGSSGSSAGSAAATAAGLLPFAIGSETWGSIISPCARCGITGLRPTFGRISRHGAMTLSWTMDKLGPICRNAEDCAIVLRALNGPDGLDPSVQDIPFSYSPNIDFSSLRIGYLQSAFNTNTPDTLTASMSNDRAVIDTLRELGARMIPIELPSLPVEALTVILDAEASAAFDDFVRAGREELLKKQESYSWPNAFRTSRFIPAVEYIRANRVRYQLMQKMDELMQTVDLYVAPSFDGNLLLTNLTGHPSVVIPNGFDDKSMPTSISFTGRLYDEGTLLAVAKKYQDATGWHLKHPDLDEKGN